MIVQNSKKYYQAAIAIAVLIAAFVSIASFVTQGKTHAFDESTLLAINSISTAPLNATMIVAAHTGDIATVIALTILLSVLLYKKNRHNDILPLAATVAGAITLNAGLKLLFQRDRPELWELLVQESTFSFPSGHALITSALITIVVYLLWRTRLRYTVLAGGVFYGALVSFSRLYLGVHYPTDVVAGWCVGIAWALIVIVAAKLWRQRSASLSTKS